ncbi:MAG: pitrilysin family protein [Planctomycetota bacterium]
MTAIEEAQVTSLTLGNGMTLLVQPMPWLRTAAYSLWLPGGITAEVDPNTLSVTEVPEQDPRAGLAALVCEMVQRGAGNFNSRELVAAEENLGIDTGGSTSTSVVGFNGAMPSDSLLPSLDLLADLVRRPHLPLDQLDDAKMVLRQEMMAINDEPTQRMMRELKRRQFGPHLGRSGLVTPVSLDSLSINDVRSFYEAQYQPGDAILAIAGNIDERAVEEHCENLFGDWPAKQTQRHETGTPIDGHCHLESPSSQTHLGLAFDCVAYGSPDYYTLRAGIGLLSDGMSSRLFDRVREQRGLCYTVSASCQTIGRSGAVFVYAGTKPERAQETLDVTVKEIRELALDIQQDELDRWKVRCESSLIMEQESARSRTSSMASDQFRLGRVMPMSELESILGEITIGAIRDHWQQAFPKTLRSVVLGESPLDFSNAYL